MTPPTIADEWAAAPTRPHPVRFGVAYAVLGVLLALSLVATGAFAFSSHAVHTRTVKVEKDYGKGQPVSVDDVSPDAIRGSGMTGCVYYQGEHALVCR